MDMPIIRPGDKSQDTSDLSYDEYLAGTEEYLKGRTEELESRQKRKSRIKRGGLDFKDRVLSVAAGRLAREYKEREKTLKEKDVEEYREAEEARPIYSGKGALDQTGLLSGWVEKYKGVLGRGEGRYEKETEFLKGQQTAIKEGTVKEESIPFGLGRKDLLTDTTGNYEVIERYPTGEPKKVVERAKQYVSKRTQERRKPYKYEYKTYIPYEATLSKEGNVLSEINREVVKLKSKVTSKSATDETYVPAVIGELTYHESGTPKSLVGKAIYRSDFYQSPSTVAQRSEYKIFDRSKVTFDEGGNIVTKDVYGDAPKSATTGNLFGGTFTRKPYLETSYDFTEGQKISFPKPEGKIRYTGEYAKKLEAARQPVVKKAAWYNPYTGKGKTNTGVYFKTTVPKAQSLRGPNIAVQSPKTGKYISWKVNPYTDQKFRSKSEFTDFWKSREGMVGSTIMRQDLLRNIRESDNIIPSNYWGKSSPEFGEVNERGLIEKTPGELAFGKYFWY